VLRHSDFPACCSDVSTLADPAALAVGVLLLFALAAGAVGGFRLLRAAHGRLRVVSIAELPPEVIAQHTEALDAARQLRQGIVMTTLCGALLVSAVAVTWYGPPKTGPMPRLQTQDRTVCSAVVRSYAGTVVLATAHGEETVSLQAIQDMTQVAAC
jgi:hypothetical protein